MRCLWSLKENSQVPGFHCSAQAASGKPPKPPCLGGESLISKDSNVELHPGLADKAMLGHRLD